MLFKKRQDLPDLLEMRAEKRLKLIKIAPKPHESPQNMYESGQFSALNNA